MLTTSTRVPLATIWPLHTLGSEVKYSRQSVTFAASLLSAERDPSKRFSPKDRSLNVRPKAPSKSPADPKRGEDQGQHRLSSGGA